MSRINRTKYTILGLLTTGSMSGYDMKKQMEKATSNFWSESSGQLYPSLKKLLKEKYVQCDEDQTTGDRTRKVYSITRKGIRLLSAWLKKPAESQMIRNEMLLKLFFGKNMLIDDCINHVKLCDFKNKRKLEYFERIRKHIQEEHKNSENVPYWEMTINYGIHLVHAELEWCKETLHLLNIKKHKE